MFVLPQRGFSMHIVVGVWLHTWAPLGEPCSALGPKCSPGRPSPPLQSHKCSRYKPDRCLPPKQPKNPRPRQPLQQLCAEQGCGQPEPVKFELISFCSAVPLARCSPKHSQAPFKESMERLQLRLAIKRV